MSLVSNKQFAIDLLCPPKTKELHSFSANRSQDIVIYENMACLFLFLGIRGGGSTNASNGTKNLRQSAGNSSIVSGQANSDLRKKEVVLAKISLYMVFVFLICHSVKIVPNIFEMVQTYYEVSLM